MTTGSPHASIHGRRVSREPSRRARDLDLRRKVNDVTAHPAFRNTARMIARLYGALHDPAQDATC